MFEEFRSEERPVAYKSEKNGATLDIWVLGRMEVGSESKKISYLAVWGSTGYGGWHEEYRG